MSFFGITIEQIDTISPIEGADRIQKATLKNLDFTFVIGKDSFIIGERVLYFPLDSLLPEELSIKLGVAGKLSGHAKNRIKSVKLKGIISQGIVGKFSLLEEIFVEKFGPDWMSKTISHTPEEITEWFGVKKYEPSAVLEKGANLVRLPCNLPIYDIEGIERHQYVVDYMMDKKVKILEKVEGQNVHFDYDFSNKKAYVSQRRFTIEEIPGSEHTWWKYARSMNLDKITETLANRFSQNIAIYGEGVGPGIQSNIYNFPVHKVLFFDVKVGERFLDCDDFFSIMSEFDLPTVPIIARDITLSTWLGDKTIKEMSDGPSQLYKTDREGIVISLMKEENINRFGRSIIKKRGPIYLSKTDN